MRPLALIALALATVVSATPSLAAENSEAEERHLNVGVAKLEAGPLEQSLGVRPKFQVTADDEQTSLDIQYGWSQSRSRGFGTEQSVAAFRTFSVAGSLPLSDSGGSKLTSLDALATGGSLALKYSSTRLDRAASFDHERFKDICRRHRKVPVTPDAPLGNSCSTDELTEAGERLFDEAMWGKNPKLTALGVVARVGSESFDYMDPSTLAEKSVDKSSWSVSAFWKHFPVDGPWVVALGFEHQDAYEAADDAILCPVGAVVADDCVYGPAGAPKRIKRDIVSAEGRYDFGPVGVVGTLDYDANNDVFAAEVPIFFALGEDGALNGGLKLSWRSDTDEVVAGVFFGRSFPRDVPTDER